MTKACLGVIAAMALWMTSPEWAWSQQRSETFNLYNNQSQRQGYGTIDRKTGRVDLYNTKSQRQGYGTITPPPGSAPESRGVQIWTPDSQTRATVPGPGRPVTPRP